MISFLLNPRMHFILLICLFIMSITSVFTYETDEMQMFDLVEEVKISFYDFLDIPPDATSTEIRKAYRKLSLSLHPDKNPDNPAAEKSFRHLTAIYGILKDDKMRENYDNILEHGLPDWRQSVFYYRQLRKMSSIEISIVSVLIAICIHYACIWGISYETRWTKSEQLAQLYKRHKVNGKKRNEVDEQIRRDLDEHYALPGFWDILPFAVCRWIKSLISLVPLYFNELMALLRQNREEIQNKEQTKKLLKRQRQLEKKGKTAEKSNPARPVNISSESLIELHSNLLDLESTDPTKGATEQAENEGKEWLNDEVHLLVSSINKIPSGTPNRWAKIAKKLGRSENEVISKSKQLHKLASQATDREQFRLKQASECPPVGDTSAFISGFDVNQVAEEDSSSEGSQFYTKKRAARAAGLKNSEPSVDYDASAELTASCDETEDEDGFVKLGVDDVHVSRKKQRQAKNQQDAVKTNNDQNCDWNQTQQKMLETAIKSIPKGTPERWDRISECVEGKSKAH